MMNTDPDFISERIRMAVAQSGASSNDDIELDESCNTTLTITTDDDAQNCADSLTPSEGLILEQTSMNVASSVPIVACHGEIEIPALDTNVCEPSALCLGDSNASPADLDMSPKERMRRERVRQRKMAQRQSVAFRERERLKAKDRMRALRNDPVYRYHERQRDRERRKKARLSNQVQRAREREKDRIRKSMTRSMNSEKQSPKVCLEGFQLLLGVSDSEEEEGEESWETGCPTPPQSTSVIDI